MHLKETLWLAAFKLYFCFYLEVHFPRKCIVIPTLDKRCFIVGIINNVLPAVITLSPKYRNYSALVCSPMLSHSYSHTFVIINFEHFIYYFMSK